MKKTRLFIDAHVFDNSFQGSRTYLLGLYTELIKQNNSIEFVFGAYNIDNLKEEFGDHSNVRFIRYLSRNKYIRLLFDIPWIILKNKIDISHFQYISPLFKFSKEILTVHDILFLDFPDLFPLWYRIRSKFLFKKSIRRADILLTVSEYSKSRISELFRIDKGGIYVLPNGVSEDFFNPKGEMPDVKTIFRIDNYLLYVSRFEPRKNHLILLKAFIELELWKKEYKLVFVGEKAIPDPAFDDYWQSLSQEVKSSIIHINGSYGNELKALYRNCRLFIYPSIAEGFGIPPLEAVASNVPVLCSNTTAMSDFKFLKDRLFYPFSIDVLKEKITLSLEAGNKDFSKEMEYVIQNYNWIKSARQFSSILFLRLSFSADQI